jgi:hypothetical protein
VLGGGGWKEAKADDDEVVTSLLRGHVVLCERAVLYSNPNILRPPSSQNVDEKLLQRKLCVSACGVIRT